MQWFRFKIISLFPCEHIWGDKLNVHVLRRTRRFRAVILDRVFFHNFFLFFHRNSFLKPGEMKPPPYSSMSRSASNMRSSSHSTHHRPTHKPNLAIPKNVSSFLCVLYTSRLKYSSFYAPRNAEVLYKFGPANDNVWWLLICLYYIYALFFQSHNSNDTSTPSTIEDILNVSVFRVFKFLFCRRNQNGGYLRRVKKVSRGEKTKRYKVLYQSIRSYEFPNR